MESALKIPRFRAHPRRASRRQDLYMAKRMRRESKTEAERRAADGARTAPDVSRELDLRKGSLRHWIAQSGIDAGEGPPDALTTRRTSA